MFNISKMPRFLKKLKKRRKKLPKRKIYISTIVIKINDIFDCQKKQKK